VRWRDLALLVERSGVDALPIVALVAFLMGVILAFQAALPMRQFGAEIFVADLVALSLLRELGPLMTAIVLTGRSGSAFAAELGTMRVNEEIDALSTMGVDPVRYLVVPRGLAAVAVTPFLTVFADLAGLYGGGLVMTTFGFPLVGYAIRVRDAVGPGDLLGGLFKALVFGAIVAGVGCVRGLQAGRGPAEVGRATTRAVVSGIVLIVTVDMLFAVLYHYLGL
jgi:phospholipid/cholesterol/gamma-HCH transport system permease protein